MAVVTKDVHVLYIHVRNKNNIHHLGSISLSVNWSWLFQIVKVKDHTKDVQITYDDPLLGLVSREKKLITKYDIAEDLHYSDVKEVCGRVFRSGMK